MLADLPVDRFGRLGSEVLVFDSIGSTNDVALSRSAAGAPDRAEGLIVIAETQTAGRGRRGHTWFSPPESGVYVSVVMTLSRASDPQRATMLLTIAAGVAIAEGIEAGSGLPTTLKWPNDLQVGRRKVGGILAEGARDGSGFHAVVLGYGINVRPAAYPPDLADCATSIEAELGRPADRRQLLIETLAALGQRYDDLLAGRFDVILDAWRRRAPAASGARVLSSGRTGITAGIDNDGALLVQTEDRIERVVGGEVQWL